MGCLAQTEQQIPHFFLTKVLVDFEPVLEFLMKDVGVVIEFNLR